MELKSRKKKGSPEETRGDVEEKAFWGIVGDTIRPAFGPAKAETVSEIEDGKKKREGWGHICKAKAER